MRACLPAVLSSCRVTDYIRRHGMLGSPEELARHKCRSTAVRQDQTNGCCAGIGEEWVHYLSHPWMSSNNAETLLIAALGGMGISAVS